MFFEGRKGFELSKSEKKGVESSEIGERKGG